MNRPYADEGEVQTTFNEIRATLARIEAQTTRTNGRVTRIELRMAFMQGALALLGLIVASGVGWIALFGGGK